jgi:hypothetical protein
MTASVRRASVSLVGKYPVTACLFQGVLLEVRGLI